MFRKMCLICKTRGAFAFLLFVKGGGPSGHQKFIFLLIIVTKNLTEICPPHFSNFQPAGRGPQLITKRGRWSQAGGGRGPLPNFICWAGGPRCCVKVEQQFRKLEKCWLFLKEAPCKLDFLNFRPLITPCPILNKLNFFVFATVSQTWKKTVIFTPDFFKKKYRFFKFYYRFGSENYRWHPVGVTSVKNQVCTELLRERKYFFKLSEAFAQKEQRMNSKAKLRGAFAGSRG